jgi:hypothetical protein
LIRLFDREHRLLHYHNAGKFLWNRINVFFPFSFLFPELQRLPPVVGGGQMGKSSGLSPGLDGCKLGSTTTTESSSSSGGGTASTGDHHQLTGGNRPLLQLPLGSCSTTSTTSSSSSSVTGTGKRQGSGVASTADPNKRTCLTPAGTHTSYGFKQKKLGQHSIICDDWYQSLNTHAGRAQQIITTRVGRIPQIVQTQKRAASFLSLISI